MVDDGEFLIRGCCNDTVCGYNNAGINVTGVRHYCAQDGTVPNTLPPRINPGPNGSPQGAFFCITIYPIVENLLNGCYDCDLDGLFSSCLGRDMLSCWHEAANASGKTDPSGHLISGTDQQKMQEYLMNFKTCNGYGSPAIGAIECPQNVGGNDPGGIKRCTPYMLSGLDFYGQDLYYSNYDDPTYPLGLWDTTFGSGVGSASIAVCECNVSENYVDWRTLRADYFNATAYWLKNQKNKFARSFLTFWRYDGQIGESGPWITGNTTTIDALQQIGSGTYTQVTPKPNDPKNSYTCWANGE
jgi:hypothetical protein